MKIVNETLMSSYFPQLHLNFIFFSIWQIQLRRNKSFSENGYSVTGPFNGYSKKDIFVWLNFKSYKKATGLYFLVGETSSPTINT